MPRYDYRCQDCGHVFEAEQRITADPLTDCPACNKPKLERLISRTAFSLKGGGWYSDGYGSGSSGSSGTKPTGADATFKGEKKSAEHGEKIAAAIKKSETES